jgi:uncharacterized OB-fold protein
MATDTEETQPLPMASTQPHAVTPTPLAAPAGDRCVNCGTQLASDQRYCINCGERRGRARFDTAALDTGPATMVTTTETIGPPPRFSSSTTLITGVATLLVAMGLGFLIGHDSASTVKQPAQAAAAQPVHVTISGNGSGGGSGSGSGSSSSTSAKHGKHSGKSSSTKSTPAAHISKKAVTQGAAAANKVLGGSKTKLAAPTVSQGGACSGGAGCQGGKFTGQFFGGG